jgi:hypothetical protein
MSLSPYHELTIDQWQSKTVELVKQHPLNTDELYEIVLKVWADIFRSGIGSKPFRIGVDLFPAPQIMGYLLHELIPLELEHRYPEQWRRDETSFEKDVVYIPDDAFSIEIKTSSSVRNIYGNRSYAQTGNTTKKVKSGYYLAINFQKFSAAASTPNITLVRFGWLDHDDWLGQASATGQQARLNPVVEKYKLLTLPIVK